MMRCLGMLLSCLLIAQIAPADAASFADKARRMFREKALMSAAERERCGNQLREELLRTPEPEAGGISDQVVRHANDAMKTSGCFDFYSRIVFRGSVVISAPVSNTEDVKPEDRVAQEYGRRLIVRLKSVQEESVKELDRDVGSLAAGWYSRISTVVMDLRDNPGGRMDILAKVLNAYFSPEKGLELVEYAVHGKKSSHGKSTGIGAFSGKKLVLLVNWNTASAAEYLMLKVRKAWYPQSSIVVGERPFGKGIVQCVNPIANGYDLILTCSKWSIAGVSVHGGSLEPDLHLPVSNCGDYKCIDQMLAAFGL